MYDIIFNCPGCGAELEASSTGVGTLIACPQCAGNLTVPNPALAEGLEFGEFVLEKRLGAGGMGEVWLAWQTSMKRHAAVKVLRPKLSGNERFIKHFLREVEMTGQLHHPNIISAYTAGHVGDIYYMATRFVEGVELADKLKYERRFSEHMVLKMATTVAQALKYAWDSMKMVHRDIKPHNIMVDEKNVPYVMDMGISKVVDQLEATGEEHVVAGTPGYMSPEQEAASDTDFRSDIFSLGITMFQLLTGRMPTEREDFAADSNKYPAQVSRQCRHLLWIMTEDERDKRQSSWDYVIGDIKLVLNGKEPLSFQQLNRSPVIKTGMNTDQVVNIRSRTAANEAQYSDSGTAKVEKVELAENRSGVVLSQVPPRLLSSVRRRKGLVAVVIILLLALALLLFFLLRK